MAGEKSRQDLKKSLEQLEDIPPLPAVATKILEVAGSEDAKVADVTRLIASDQGLASKVLGTCNSAYYGLPQRVKTLSRAVALLGIKSVRNLVLVHSLPWKRAGSPGFAEQMIWVHAAATAMTARVIAAQSGHCDPEEALLGGLMHDVGKLALNAFVPEEFEPVMRAVYNREGDSVAIEREALGVDHTLVGKLVLEKWSFPGELIRVAGRHHNPPEELNPLTLVVRAADEVAWTMGQGVMESPEPPTEITPALGHLGYGLEELERLEERVSETIEQGKDVFGLA